MEREELIERGPYPHSWKGSSVSIILIIAFFSLIPILVNTITANLLLELTLGTLIVCTAAFCLRIYSFRRIRGKLEESRVHSSPPPKRFGKATILLAGILFLFGPYVAVQLVDPLTWLVGLGAVICGLSLGELLLTLYANRWARERGVRLMRFEIWSINEYGYEKLIETGVRTEKVTRGEEAGA